MVALIKEEPTKTLTVNGCELKVQALTIDENIIWSANTGRVTTGEMEGDIITRKFKLIVTLAPLNDKEAVDFASAIRPAFFPIKFRNPNTGLTDTKTFYVGKPQYPVYTYVDNLPRYVGVGVDFIEK